MWKNLFNRKKPKPTINMQKAIKVVYTNWKGEISKRTIIPLEGGLFFGSNQWHETPQWLFEAYDVDKQSNRTFAFCQCNFG